MVHVGNRKTALLVPVYALQSAGAEPRVAPLDTMGALAASYLSALRRVHPNGPDVLDGWPFGGYAAFEVVRRLADDEVTGLVLLDTIALDEGSRDEIPEHPCMR